MPAWAKVRSVTVWVTQPMWKDVVVTAPAHRYAVWVTLVAVKKISTARGMMMIPMVLNCRARKASAPSWMALAMSFMVAVP